VKNALPVAAVVVVVNSAAAEALVVANVTNPF
jgi:hypothetical protein